MRILSKGAARHQLGDLEECCKLFCEVQVGASIIFLHSREAKATQNATASAVKSVT